MKISSIPQIYRNVNRWTEIISVLSKYGLAAWISRLNLDFAKGLIKDRQGEALARDTRQVRIRKALAELGPTFIKLGQLLGTRPDLVGHELAVELKKLLSAAPADPPQVVRRMVENELGQPIDDLFAEFDDESLASASIGQVHRARLKTGESVVVKVQHHGIQDTVRKDLDVLSGLAQLAEMIPEFVPYRPVATVAEFQRTLRRELDFGREEQNLEQFADRFDSDATVRIPRPYTDLCTPRVLTMEVIEGAKLSDWVIGGDGDLDGEEIARRGAELYLRMIFVDGVYHADPHPGNIILLPGNVIGLLDFGMVGRIDERLREDIEEMLLALIHQDAIYLTSIIMRVGQVPAEIDEMALRTEAADFVSHFAGQSLDRFDLGTALNELMEIIHRYNILLPAQVAMLIKTLVTLEGTSKLLCPKFSLLEVMKPFQRKAVLRRLSPRRRLKRMRRVYLELEHLAEVLPRRVMDILEQVRVGKFDVHLDHRGLGPSVNRLVLGMLASALFLGSSLLLSRHVPPVIFPEPTFLGMHKVSLLGLGGCMVALLLGLRLLRAIGKSGHLDRRD